ncbi:hypothetical protein GCM10025868_35470 [Angustibacter aerolatus]|uniref:Uncharacterized protein n=1 Tax=Angustibacter aerolatus TaxID=1162965 RepID=A0ABQ6JKI7_9ACTN|nr:hypothetical protein GCM10025868_35470 [Angustibacter aerolatus]
MRPSTTEPPGEVSRMRCSTGYPAVTARTSTPSAASLVEALGGDAVTARLVARKRMAVEQHHRRAGLPGRGRSGHPRRSGTHDGDVDLLHYEPPSAR